MLKYNPMLLSFPTPAIVAGQFVLAWFERKKGSLDVGRLFAFKNFCDIFVKRLIDLKKLCSANVNALRIELVQIKFVRSDGVIRRDTPSQDIVRKDIYIFFRYIIVLTNIPAPWRQPR